MKKIVTVVVCIGLVGLGFYLWSSNAFNSQASEALRQAEQYRPTGICTQSITPAIHTATGVRYTFNSGCLPPGWEAAS